MTQPAFLAVAAGGGHPLLDFDWTALIQLGIFFLAALAAGRLIFKPYLKMREARDARTDGARSEAASMTAEADASLESYESELGAARARANDERRKIRTEAATHQRELSEHTRGEIASATEAAEAKLRAETEAARAELLPKAADIGGQIAAQLLGREVSA